AYSQQDEAGRTAMMERIKPSIVEMYEGMDMNAEADILAALLQGYVDTVPSDGVIPAVKNIQDEYNGNFNSFTNTVKQTSVYANVDKLIQAFENGNGDAIKNDVLSELSNGLFNSYRNTPKEIESLNDSYTTNFRLFIDGMRKTYPDRIFYPDA